MAMRMRYITCFIFTFTLLILTTYLSSSDNFGRRSSGPPILVLPVPQPCPNVLRYMTKGHWDARMLIDKERRLIKDTSRLFFSENSNRKTQHLANGKCGNITNPGKVDLRALCDPFGPKPCCRNGFCSALPVQKCRCVGCFDLRQRIFADSTKWRPAHQSCQMKVYSAPEVCRLLTGYTIYFIGDSLLRHVHQGLLMVMTNGTFQGVYRPRVSKERKLLCKGMNIFTLSKCKLALRFNSTNMCNGTANIYYIPHFKSLQAQELYRTVYSSLGKDNHLFVVSHGLHDNHDITKTSDYILPTLQLLKRSKVNWPKFLWLSYHAPGLSKSPRYKKQGYLPTKRYNGEVRELLRPFRIPILDTFNLTENTFSYDGTHYGMGVVLTKTPADASSAETAACLPQYKSIKSSMYRERRERFPAMPSSRVDISLDGEWVSTSQGHRFLLADDGVGDDKILIFASDSGLLV